MSHHRHAVNADAAPAAVGPYSHAVVSGGLIFCSGQSPLDPETNELVGGSAGEQARRCLQNLEAVAAAAGGRGHCIAHDFSELQRSFKRLNLAALDNSFGNPARVRFFAVAEYDVGQDLLAPFVEHFCSRKARARHCAVAHV